MVAGAGCARGMSPGKVVPGAAVQDAHGKGVYPNIVVLLPATAARPTGLVFDAQPIVSIQGKVLHANPVLVSVHVKKYMSAHPTV